LGGVARVLIPVFCVLMVFGGYLAPVFVVYVEYVFYVCVFYAFYVFFF
jgi:hypothetical protein